MQELSAVHMPAFSTVAAANLHVGPRHTRATYPLSDRMMRCQLAVLKLAVTQLKLVMTEQVPEALDPC
jgi:hypothetical protein